MNFPYEPGVVTLISGDVENIKMEFYSFFAFSDGRNFTPIFMRL